MNTARFSRPVQKMLARLTAANVPFGKVEDRDDEADGDITLAGEFDGISVQVGAGYYCVTKDTADDDMIFIDGTGDLLKDINTAKAAT